MSRPPWRILFVGLGGAGQRHLRVVRELLGDQAELFAYRTQGRPHVITPSYQLDTSRDVEAEYGITRVPSLDAAVALRPDVAFVCNPTALHIQAALPLARAGCHLCIEKPLSHSWDGVDALRDAARANHLTVLLAYQLRFHPCLAWIEARLDEGRLGRLQSASLWVDSYLPALHPYEAFRDQYIARKDLGGGVILTESHEIDYALWLFGMPRRVFARGGCLGPYPLDVEDTASLLLECGPADRPFPVHLAMSMVQKPARRGCRISGAKGQIVWNAAEPEVRLYDADADAWTVETFPGFERRRLFTGEVGHFLDCVQSGRPTRVDLEAGADGLRIALAAKASLESGHPVDPATMAPGA